MKPFFKYPGGKSWLIAEILDKVKDTKFDSYVEPFVGGGAVLLGILNKYPSMPCIIADKNPVIYAAWASVKHNVDSLVSRLETIETDYQGLTNEADRSEYYYDLRSRFNRVKGEYVRVLKLTDKNCMLSGEEYLALMDLTRIKLDVAALFLATNKLCFNGLYRENSKGELNVPFGKYPANRRLFDLENIRKVSKAISETLIFNQGYEHTLEDLVSNNSLIYCDPPYKSSIKTFNYHGLFDSADELILAAKLVRICKQRNSKALVSNAFFPEYFDRLFPYEAGWNIRSVITKRRINSDASKRNDIPELLISNF